MKTGEVKDPGDGTDHYLDCDGWTPWLYYDPSDEELERYYTDTNALMMRLERMPPAVHRRQKRIDLRCPAKGCRLAAVYWLPRRPTAWEIEDDRRRLAIESEWASRVLEALPAWPLPLRGAHPWRCRGVRHPQLRLRAFAEGSRSGSECHRRLYWRAGCRHGTATVERASIYDMFFIADRRSRPCRPKNRLLRTSLITCGRYGASASSIPNLRRGIQGNEPPDGSIAITNSTKHTRAATRCGRVPVRRGRARLRQGPVRGNGPLQPPGDGYRGRPSKGCVSVLSNGHSLTGPCVRLSTRRQP